MVEFEFVVRGFGSGEGFVTSGWCRIRHCDSDAHVATPDMVIEGASRIIIPEVVTEIHTEEPPFSWLNTLSRYFADEEGGKVLLASMELLGIMGILTAVFVR